ncbi:hypothetical protein [Streptomyces spiramenti]|uniref:Uncharacterized protein n=1 Tax=Streptomyces spiramenti TaxID=2720606 RepID=A0ABX1AK85_9ACTN|nr:hypothetical protein [Streptomyces spiramenti]NJP66081.1 hypothetical protein [Streptomyces spiramenti]
MKQLSGAVHDLASELVSALRGGDHSVAGTTGSLGGDEALTVAAARTLGADVLLPSTLLRRPAPEPDVAVCRAAVHAYPPGPQSSPTVAWSHWAMERALAHVTAVPQHTPSAAGPLGGAATDGPDTPHPAGNGGPDVTALREATWQAFTHQLSVLAALAVPGADSAVAAEAARRPVDVSRGFVRAVRRRDWLQAAGAGRWLAVIDGVPPTLGLDAGLRFVLRMGGADARVALHVHAALLMRADTPYPAAPGRGSGT